MLGTEPNERGGKGESGGGKEQQRQECIKVGGFNQETFSLSTSVASTRNSIFQSKLFFSFFLVKKKMLLQLALILVAARCQYYETFWLFVTDEEAR